MDQDSKIKTQKQDKFIVLQTMSVYSRRGILFVISFLTLLKREKKMPKFPIAQSYSFIEHHWNIPKSINCSYKALESKLPLWGVFFKRFKK